uniref:Serine-threonine/tyrosine-protein kinase catalytic domain-containing protein n=1 Tax=Rhizophagus irregularis (strain DAOM 181602 / DAOM 197198 / MUCL 43194) TaxID=747089 RepID=U9U8M6_RHIID
MKRCWNEDPLKRPSASEVRGIIGSWIFHYSDNTNDELISNDIMEFINAPVGYATESLPQFLSKKELEEILENKYLEPSVSIDLNEMLDLDDLDDYTIKDTKSLDED